MSKSLEEAYKIYRECVLSEEYDRGIAALSLLIDDGVDAHKSLQLRAHLHGLAGDEVRAKNDLDDAIEIEPASGLYYDRGALYHRTKEYYLALRDFCETVRLAQASGDDDLIDAVEHHIVEILGKMRSE